MPTRTIAAIAAAAATHAALAGPLTPPPGAPAPTNKTLSQVQPGVPLEDTGTTINIASPGFYYLTENVSSTGVGIVIQSTGVTLDLNGYTVIGNLSGNSAHNGITIAGVADGRPVTIRNGNIHRFSGDGISAVSSLASVVLENVHISDCESNGVDLNGNLAATDCTALNNDQQGFLVDGDSQLEKCIARNNGLNGFLLERGTIKNCQSSFNGDSGFELGFLRLDAGSILITDSLAEGNNDRGIYVNNNSVIVNCIAMTNGAAGIQGTRDVVIENCATRFNTQWGFLTGFNTAITNCIAAQNGDDGFNIGSSSGISNCGAYLNGDSGFDTGLGCGISDCGARQNAAEGFIVGASSAITNCGSSVNGTDGFSLESDSRIFHCAADGNGTDASASPTPAGIRSVSDCIIDSCHVTDNDIGISATTGTLTVRCSAAGNSVTNYDFAAGAEYAEIITGTPNFTTSNAWANFEF